MRRSRVGPALTMAKHRRFQLQKEQTVYGLTQGTRHYIQFRFSTEDTWTDLLFVEPGTTETKGLWCSKTYRKALEKIQALIAEVGNEETAANWTEYYRIVKRTYVFSEHFIEHDPNYGKAFNDPSYDFEHDPDDEKIGDGTIEDDENSSLDDDVTVQIVNDEPKNPLAN